MRRTITLGCALILGTSIGVFAKGNGRANGHAQQGVSTPKPLPPPAQANHPMTNRSATLSNGSRSTDRDFGHDRAVEVGKGKKKGLTKTHTNHKRGNGR